jgi:hypothetical protein
VYVSVDPTVEDPEIVPLVNEVLNIETGLELPEITFIATKTLCGDPVPPPPPPAP